MFPALILTLATCPAPDPTLTNLERAVPIGYPMASTPVPACWLVRVGNLGGTFEGLRSLGYTPELHS